MNCKKCGYLLTENDKFCSNCGTPVNNQFEQEKENNDKRIIVNRVFCYSKNEAIKNGNSLPIKQLVLIFVIFFVVLIAISIIRNTFIGQSEFLEFIVIMLPMIFSGLIIYYSFILGIRLAERVSAFVITNDNRIFRVATTNNGNGRVIGGIAAGSIIDKLSSNNNNIGRNIGGAIGAASQLHTMNKNSHYMSNPEVIAKIVESSETVKVITMMEILKVYSIKEGKHSFKVNCDFKIVNINKTRYNKNLYISKSYNCLILLKISRLN